MEILEAFDLTHSFRDAAELAGCSHHTVVAWVAKRDAGQLPIAGEAQRRERKIDPFLPKVEEWVERSLGKIRADVVFARLRRLGFTGSDRTVRRAVGEAKAHYRHGNHRVYRPWIPEPGMWAQWDWGEGLAIDNQPLGSSRHQHILDTPGLLGIVEISPVLYDHFSASGIVFSSL